jgi:hypothetical protein
MNTYLIKSKVELIKEARQDFLDIYGIEHTPFTRKLFFYFFVYNNKKYVHKKSLNFVYSNADTWTTDKEPICCELTKQISPPGVVDFLSSYAGTLLPTLVENNEKFLVFEYLQGQAVDSITSDEFYYIEQQHEKLQLTPFYNSMAYNLIRNQNIIKLTDLKHFEQKQNLPFFLYMYNEQNCVNTLYIKTNTDTNGIVQHLGKDYPVKNCITVEY